MFQACKPATNPERFGLRCGLRSGMQESGTTADITSRKEKKQHR